MSILRFKKANCKNCYKCIRNCPIKAIELKDGQAQVIENDCVLCGKCVLVCPQNAKEVRNDVSAAKALIASGKKVFASVAPAFIASYGFSGIDEFSAYLKKLGFFDVSETAQGAYVVKSEYEKMVENPRAGCDYLLLLLDSCDDDTKVPPQYTKICCTDSFAYANARKANQRGESGRVCCVYWTVYL